MKQIKKANKQATIGITRKRQEDVTLKIIEQK